FVGATGLYCSVRAASSWRSLLWTKAISYVGGFFLYMMSLPLIFVVYLLVLLSLVVFDQMTGTGFARGFVGGFGAFLIGSYVVLLGVFGLLTWYFINDAEKYVADRERVRHWKDEPVVRSRRPVTVKPSSTATPSV